VALVRGTDFFLTGADHGSTWLGQPRVRAHMSDLISARPLCDRDDRHPNRCLCRAQLTAVVMGW